MIKLKSEAKEILEKVHCHEKCKELDYEQYTECFSKCKEEMKNADRTRKV